jgi:peptidoglycan/xylan/chitin deacetylase (PgdA/CDA1 family)
MPATTSRLKRPRRRILRGLLWLVALAAAVCALAVVHMYRQGHFFRYANPSQWMLRWQGRYGFDARKGILRQAATKSRIVALTFDDGPHTSSPLLLDVLKGQGAHATFFLVGANVVKYPEIAKRMLAEGNDVGNHTRTHLRLPALRDDQVRAEIENDTIVIGRATGHRVRLFRPPGGQYDDRVTAEAQRQGMLTVLWSNNTGDWQAKDPAWIVNRVLSDVQPGDVILLHEDYPQTLAAMPGILAGLRARGYRAVTVSEMLKETGVQLPPVRHIVP